MTVLGNLLVVSPGICLKISKSPSKQIDAKGFDLVKATMVGLRLNLQVIN